MGSWIGRPTLDRLRQIPLRKVLESVGARPDPRDKAKWRGPTGTLSVHASQFMNWTLQVGGGGAIDLAMHLLSTDFSHAVAWLLKQFPEGDDGLIPPTPADADLASRTPSQTRTARPIPNRPIPFHPPALAPRHLMRVRNYLWGQRRLPPSLLGRLIDQGVLYADPYANAVFLLLGNENKPVGAELRGTGPSVWRALAPGSRKDQGFFAVGPSHPTSFILCESAIDALSCATIHPQARCISTSGARVHPFWLDTLIQLGLPIYCGYDADPAGDLVAKNMIVRNPGIQRLRPEKKDWNLMLK